jgi:hypothetical protein
LTLDELASNQALSSGLVVMPKIPNFSSSSPEFHVIKSVLRTGEIKNIQNGENDGADLGQVINIFYN